VAILARGQDLGASALASEIDLEPTQVSSLLTRLEHDGRVTRTAGGNWAAAPAAMVTTEPALFPKVPEQEG
jgi:DNA-binding GntR family transcriptional regulator